MIGCPFCLFVCPVVLPVRTKLVPDLKWGLVPV